MFQKGQQQSQDSTPGLSKDQAHSYFSFLPLYSFLVTNYIPYSSPLIILLTFLSFDYIPIFLLVIFHNQSEGFSSGRDGEIGDRVNKKNTDDKIICKQEIF